MFETVLFPIDQSREALETASKALELARSHSSRLVLLSVVQPERPEMHDHVAVAALLLAAAAVLPPVAAGLSSPPPPVLLLGLLLRVGLALSWLLAAQLWLMLRVLPPLPRLPHVRPPRPAAAARLLVLPAVPPAARGCDGGGGMFV